LSEQLQQYRVKEKGKWVYEGTPLGSYDRFVIGSTTLSQLKTAGIIADFTTEINFRPTVWKGKPTTAAKPDELVLDGQQTILVVRTGQVPISV